MGCVYKERGIEVLMVMGVPGKGYREGDGDVYTRKGKLQWW